MSPHEPYEDDLAYIQSELKWVETRCRRLLTGQKLTEARGDVDIPRWSNSSDEPVADIEDRLGLLEIKEKAVREKIDHRLDATRQAGIQLGLDQLVDLYDLSALERKVLLMAVALPFSSRYEQLYGELQNSVFALTVEVAYRFCELPLAERIKKRRIFSRRGPLVRHDLISVDLSSRFNAPEDLLTAQIQLSNRTFGFLVGNNHFADEFLDFSSVEEPRASIEQVVLPSADKERILSVIERHDEYLRCRKAWGFDDIITYGRGVLLLFHGRPGTGKTMMAHAVAKELQQRILNVDIPTFLEHRDADHFLPALFREARMQNALLFFDECEALFTSRKKGNALMTMLLTEIERFEGIAVLATNMPQQLDEALDRRILVKVRFPEPDRMARKAIWKRHLPDSAPIADDVNLDVLAEKYELSGGHIKNAVLTAVASAVHNNEKAREITMPILEESARNQITRPVGGDAPIITARARLDDVVLPPALKAAVEELVEAVRHQRTVFEKWGLFRSASYGDGVSALFYGEPGTGKTMCAEAIAFELNRPLLIASPAALKSKWVGETESNIQDVFATARAHNAVLLFDEADSFFQAHGQARASRHDDSMVNTLLTRIERHEGLVILTSNRQADLDPALPRRLTYSLCFPLPGPSERTQIWRQLLGGDQLPTEGSIDFKKLGDTYCLSGAAIRSIVWKIVFRAARQESAVTMTSLQEVAATESSPQQQSAIGFAG